LSFDFKRYTADRSTNFAAGTFTTSRDISTVAAKLSKEISVMM
jgi:hypothetical protein